MLRTRPDHRAPKPSFLVDLRKSTCTLTIRKTSVSDNFKPIVYTSTALHFHTCVLCHMELIRLKSNVFHTHHVNSENTKKLKYNTGCFVNANI